MKLLILAFALTTGYSAQADTDWNCVRGCQAQGSEYGFCTNQCSYHNQVPQFSVQKQPDWACVRNCQAQGNDYNYCAQRLCAQ